MAWSASVLVFRFSAALPCTDLAVVHITITSRDRAPHVGPVIIVEQEKDAVAPAPVPASSGAHYVANYSVPLGFRVGLLLGTHPKPDALSMNVSVGAQFTDHGGLGRLEIAGQLYGLSAIPDSARAPVKGRVSIVYDNTGGEEVVDGNFDVFLNMPPIRGSGSNNLLVHAGFHTGPDGWYFKMGEPKMDAQSTDDPVQVSRWTWRSSRWSQAYIYDRLQGYSNGLAPCSPIDH
ncbi:MAG: hypothetical protein IPG11_15930 [Flavobacteriales bacterium]|nr:hypothetical protein [Flavobacteriales bacterium]